MEVGRSIKLQEYVNDLYMSLLNIHSAKKVSRSAALLAHVHTCSPHQFMT